MAKKQRNEVTIHSSAAEYLTYIAATGDNPESYEDENIWFTQKMIATLYLDYAELQAERHIPMSMKEWSKRLDGFLEFNSNEILTGPGKISVQQAKLHAESEFEKYRVVQDKLFKSDYNLFLEEFEK